MTYLEDGRCSLSNNPSENSLRPVTLGRKNWLFSDSPDGANASMVVYTMVVLGYPNTWRLRSLSHLSGLWEPPFRRMGATDSGQVAQRAPE